MKKVDMLVVGAGALAKALYPLWQPKTMIGLRRKPHDAPFPLIHGDTTDGAFWEQEALQLDPSTVLITATPGLRGGGSGNDLATLCGRVRAQFPAARLLYTASTAVYGDGQELDDGAPVQTSGRAPALLEIEDAVLSQGNALVLRVGAIVGPSRMPKRLRNLPADAQQPLVISGDPQRPFPFIHQADLMQVLLRLANDRQQTGRMNCVSPHQLTYEAYYRGYLSDAAMEIVSDGAAMPRRQINASRLWQLMGDYPWRQQW